LDIGDQILIAQRYNNVIIKYQIVIQAKFSIHQMIYALKGMQVVYANLVTCINNKIKINSRIQYLKITNAGLVIT
jgi:hypothetical protein